MTGKMSSSNNFSDYIGDWVAGTVGGRSNRWLHAANCAACIII